MAEGTFSRRTFLSQTAAFGLAISAGPLLAACGGSSGPETTFTKAQRTKTINVGFANEPPFAYLDSSNKLTGEAVELLRAALGSYGITNFVPVLTDFSALIPGLVAKRFDVIGAGMYIRPARCQQIIFANPEYQMGEAFAVKKGNPKNLHSWADVAKNSSAIFGTELGTAEVDYANVAGVPKSRQRLFPDYATAVTALQSGQIDVEGQLAISLRTLLQKINDPNIEYVELSEQPKDNTGHTAVGYGAMGFRKEDTDFRDAFNQKLKEYVSNGKLHQIQAPFGFTEAMLPPVGVTAADICAGKIG